MRKFIAFTRFLHPLGRAYNIRYLDLYITGFQVHILLLVNLTN